MPSLTVNYYAYARRGRRRSATTTSLPIAPSLNSTPAPGTSATINAFDISGYPKFAFWSITGEDGGSRVSSNRFETVLAASAPLVATAWYLPTGGGPGNGAPGIGIDAFDVDRGEFFDDDFVTVAPAGSLTAGANENGWVPTATAQTITAFDPCSIALLGTSKPFQTWLIVDPPPSSGTGTQLQPPVNSNGTAFAMYRTPDRPDIPRPRVDDILTWVQIFGGVKVDGGGIVWGPGGPVPVGPWGPLVAQLSPSVREAVVGLLLNEMASGLSQKDAAAALSKVGVGMARNVIAQLAKGRTG